jgi:hypothetical protein
VAFFGHSSTPVQLGYSGRVGPHNRPGLLYPDGSSPTLQGD